MGTNSGCGCRGGGTPYSSKTMSNMTGGARKKRGTKKAKRGGGIVSTAAAPAALYGLARMAHRRKRHSKNRTRRRSRRKMRGGNPGAGSPGDNPGAGSPGDFNGEMTPEQAKRLANKMNPGKRWSNSEKKYVPQKGGSVLGNALPSLVLYGLSKTFRGTKKHSNHNGNKTRKNLRRKRSRRGRRM